LAHPEMMMSPPAAEYQISSFHISQPSSCFPQLEEHQPIITAGIINISLIEGHQRAYIVPFFLFFSFLLSILSPKFGKVLFLCSKSSPPNFHKDHNTNNNYISQASQRAQSIGSYRIPNQYSLLCGSCALHSSSFLHISSFP
jgi:hypothetical protein